MSFSPSQNGTHYRPMVDRAWRAHCDRECITDSTPACKKTWYKAELKKCFGFDSTTACNKKEDFEKAMAWFEELAGDGIYWQVQLIRGDAKRAHYLLDNAISLLRLTEDYVAGVQRQMQILKPLRDCTADELLKLRLSLLYHCRRQQDRFVQEPQSKGSSAPPA